MAGVTGIDGDTKNEACWDIKDALSFKILPHFRLPTDQILSPEVMRAHPTTQVIPGKILEDPSILLINSPAEIVRVEFDGKSEHFPTIASPRRELRFTAEELEARFDRTKSLKLSVLGMNGRSLQVSNVWRLFSNVSYIKVPGSDVVLQKKSIISEEADENIESYKRNGKWEWAVLLQEKGADGTREFDARRLREIC